MTLGEAARAGITHVRKAAWVYPDDVLVIEISAHGLLCPWATLRSPTCAPACGLAVEQRLLVVTELSDDWLDASAPRAPAGTTQC